MGEEILEVFEDKIDVINRELSKRRGSWNLDCLSNIDFDDVCQLIRIHIYNKWALWDQSRPFENWVNTVISRQLINIRRNVYTSLAPPCIKCDFDEGENRCGYTSCGLKTSECKLYAKWEKKKKTLYNLKITASSVDDPNYIEGRDIQDIHGMGNMEIDFVKSAATLQEHLKNKLNDYQYTIYKLLYVHQKSEKEVAELMGYKTSEDNRNPGYKQLNNIKNAIMKEAQKILEEKDVITT